MAYCKPSPTRHSTPGSEPNGTRHVQVRPAIPPRFPTYAETARRLIDAQLRTNNVTTPHTTNSMHEWGHGRRTGRCTFLPKLRHWISACANAVEDAQRLTAHSEKLVDTHMVRAKGAMCRETHTPRHAASTGDISSSKHQLFCRFGCARLRNKSTMPAAWRRCAGTHGKHARAGGTRANAISRRPKPSTLRSGAEDWGSAPPPWTKLEPNARGATSACRGPDCFPGP